MSVFKTIVADPPWPYATPGKGPLQSSKKHRPKSFDYSRDGATAGSSAHSRYGLMTLANIKALGVAALVADNTFRTLRAANIKRLPLFKDAHGRTCHAPTDDPKTAGFDWTPAQWLQAVVGELGEYANLRKKCPHDLESTSVPLSSKNGMRPA